MTELHELSATRQRNSLRAKEISALELTEHYLGRIDRLEPELGALVTVAAERAREEAARADELLVRGESPPLCGLPIGIKDLFATKGIRTTLGSAAMAEHVPGEDSWTVELLRDAGAVVLGKTNTPEFGSACFTDNAVTARPAVTPYDLGRYSSGSSGGAATAVAAGLLPFAQASDSAGSIRTPASTCHLVGVKPSRGLVSSAPATGFVSAGTEGPIARTVADAALLLDVLARPWPGNLHGWRPSECFAEAATREPARPLTIAWWTTTGLDGVDPHPDAVAAARHTTALLSELGHEVREIAIPVAMGDHVRKAMVGWFASEVSAAVTTLRLPPERVALLSPYNRHLAATGAAMSADDLALAHAVLARYASEFLAALDEFDVVLTPTTNGPPAPLGHFLADGVDRVSERMLAWSCHTPWANLTGQPAISVPAHVDADGLPHGVQLVGRRHGDAELVALAAQLERGQRWDRRRPPCWSE